MKVAYIHVDCCRECPFAEDYTGQGGYKYCTQQDNKAVVANEIDAGCPLDDETWEAK